jgi:hypothetical protein
MFPFLVSYWFVTVLVSFDFSDPANSGNLVLI